MDTLPQINVSYYKGTQKYGCTTKYVAMSMDEIEARSSLKSFSEACSVLILEVF